MSRPTLTRTLLLAAATAIACLALASQSSASSGQLTIMQDDYRLLRTGPNGRARTLAEFDRLGADVVKVHVYWNEVAPRSKPADPYNHRQYPGWGVYDDVVRRARAAGLRVYFSISVSLGRGFPRPGWLGGGKSGTYRPSTSAMRAFAHAAGQRYSGSYGGLPRVTIWSFWNEPHLWTHLKPQRGRRRVPLSPSIYRRLYLAGYSGLRSSGHYVGRDTILLGELTSFGTGHPQRVTPLQFLREMVCLSSRYRQFRGSSASRRGCGVVGRIPASGLAYHPYTLRKGPRVRIRNRDEAAIGHLHRVRRTLRGLARKGKLPSGLPIWITEFSYQSNPPDPFGSRLVTVARNMDESEWIAYRSPSVRSYAQYQLVDDKPRCACPSFLRWSTLQAGLRFNSGRAKPFVYKAFQYPLFVRLGSRGLVEIFGGVRHAPGGRVRIETRRFGSSTWRALATSQGLNGQGYFRRFFRLSSASRRYYRIKYNGVTRTKRGVRR